MNINMTIFAQVISFIIFVIFCIKYVWVPLISIIEKRQKEISDAFSSAEQAQKLSDTVKAEANNYLEYAKNESQLIISNANKYREQLIDQAKFEAESEKTKILAQAYAEIRFEKNRVFDALQTQIGSIIISGVEKVIEYSMNPSIDHDIINKAIDKLNISCNEGK